MYTEQNVLFNVDFLAYSFPHNDTDLQKMLYFAHAKYNSFIFIFNNDLLQWHGPPVWNLSLGRKGVLWNSIL